MTDMLLPFRDILQQVNCGFLTIGKNQRVVEVEEVALEALLQTAGGFFNGMTQASSHEKMERQIKPAPRHLQYCKVKWQK